MAFEIMVLVVMALGVVRASVPDSGRRLLALLRRSPNPPILVFVLYGAASWYRSPWPGFSGAEWLRLACGAGLYLVIAAALRQREQVRALVNVLVVATILTTLFGLISYGSSDQTSMSSSFGNGQLFSGFLLMMLPLLLVLAFGEPELRHRIPAQIALGLGGFGLLLTQTRSSWLGALVALVVLALLAWRMAPPASLGRLRHQIVVPLVIAVGAIGLFLMASNTAPMVRARAASSRPLRGTRAWAGGWSVGRGPGD